MEPDPKRWWCHGTRPPKDDDVMELDPQTPKDDDVMEPDPQKMMMSWNQTPKRWWCHGTRPPKDDDVMESVHSFKRSSPNVTSCIIHTPPATDGAATAGRYLGESTDSSSSHRAATAFAADHRAVANGLTSLYIRTTTTTGLERPNRVWLDSLPRMQTLRTPTADVETIGIAAAARAAAATAGAAAAGAGAAARGSITGGSSRRRAAGAAAGARAAAARGSSSSRGSSSRGRRGNSRGAAGTAAGRGCRRSRRGRGSNCMEQQQH